MTARQILGWNDELVVSVRTSAFVAICTVIRNTHVDIFRSLALHVQKQVIFLEMFLRSLTGSLSRQSSQLMVFK